MMMMEINAKITVISITSIIDRMKNWPSAKFNTFLSVETGVPGKWATSAWFFNADNCCGNTGDDGFFNCTKPEQSGCFFFFFKLGSWTSNSWSDKEKSFTFDVSEDEKEFEKWVEVLVDVFSWSLLDISSSSLVKSRMLLYLFNDNAILSLD